MKIWNINIEIKNYSIIYNYQASLNIKKLILLYLETKININNTNLQVKIDQIVFDQVDKINFREVIKNKNLKWNDHLKTITNKVGENIMSYYIIILFILLYCII